MRRILMLLVALMPLLPVRMVWAQEAWEPLAAEEAMVASGNARFTVLTPRMIRIQYSTSHAFEDRATFAVVNRRLPVPRFTATTEDGYLIIATDSLVLRYREGAVINATRRSSKDLSITFRMGAKEKLWYPGKDDAMNLLGTSRTLDGNIGDTHRAKMEKGLLSRDGWAILDESPSAVRGDGSHTFAFDKTVDGIPWVATPLDSKAIDWYFLGYGHHYKDALADYVKIAGRQPMPPYYMFGYWYSKYQAYSSTEFQQLVRDMESKDVPHDVIMLDMDWHKSGWTGWTWNTSLIPSPTSLLSWMHTHKMKTSLNLHPADGIGSGDQNFSKIRDDMGLPSSATTVPWQLEDSTFYRTFFKHIIREREREGVDFWWLDWQQDLTSKYITGLGETFWLNHVYYNDMRLHRTDRRPVIFHRWGGMGSHRYPLGFSGDTFATYGTLRFESYFTATAANVCFGYWGHDGGGYLQPADQPTDPELMLRWMQFCVFQPIFRTHGSSQSSCERRVWKFANLDLQREAFRLRYTLVPYIYTCAREAYDTGLSICRPLYYEWPEENKAYSTEDEYLFGPDILCAPISCESQADGTTPRRVWLPKGQWYDVCRGRLVDGDTELTDQYALSEIPFFLRAGSIIPCHGSLSNLKSSPSEMVLWVVPGDGGSGKLYEDNGDSEAYRHGEYALTRFVQAHGEGYASLTISPREGQYAGMVDKRSYEVRFLLADRPLEVCVDDEAYPHWTYDEVQRQLTVTLPAKSCTEGTTIKLYNTATALSSPTGVAVLDVRYSAASAQLTVCAPQPVASLLLTVADMQGRECLRKRFAHTGSVSLDVRTLPTGTYVCRVLADGATCSRKFIKL